MEQFAGFPAPDFAPPQGGPLAPPMGMPAPMPGEPGQSGPRFSPLARLLLAAARQGQRPPMQAMPPMPPQPPPYKPTQPPPDAQAMRRLQGAMDAYARP